MGTTSSSGKMHAKLFCTWWFMYLHIHSPDLFFIMQNYFLLQDVEFEFPEFYLYSNRNLTDLGLHWMIPDSVVGCNMFITFAIYSWLLQVSASWAYLFCKTGEFPHPNTCTFSYSFCALSFVSCMICCPYVSWNREFFCRPFPGVGTASFLPQLYQMLCVHT